MCDNRAGATQLDLHMYGAVRPEKRRQGLGYWAKYSHSLSGFVMGVVARRGLSSFGNQGSGVCVLSFPLAQLSTLTLLRTLSSGHNECLMTLRDTGGERPPTHTPSQKRDYASRRCLMSTYIQNVVCVKGFKRQCESVCVCEWIRVCLEMERVEVLPIACLPIAHW